MASGKYWNVRHVLAVWSTFICASLVITPPGVGALRFLNDPKVILVGHFGYNINFNCTTDDPNATVSLLHSSQFGPLTERPLTPGKLILNGQVFTVINLVRSDGGMYACKATSESGESIQWPFGTGRLLLSQNILPSHFVLIPSKAIFVLQGKSKSVTCESEGVSVVTLKWEKKTGSGSYVDVPAGWVTVINDTSTNRIRAVLKITNAKDDDDGVYKCTVAIRNKSTYKLTRISVVDPGPPLIQPYTGKTAIKEGEDKILRCVAEGSPKPDVTWYRDGKKLNTTDCKNDPKSCENILYEVYEQNPDSPRHTIYTDGVLKIRKALYPRDDGEFKCVASNGNLPNAELTIDLDVQVSPKIHQQINQHVAQEGKETEVFCVIEKGNPLPTFKWQYQPLDCPNGKTDCPPDESQWWAVPTSLMVTPTATPTNKSIVKVEKDEANTFYRCQASNSLGNDSQVVKLVRTALDIDACVNHTCANGGSCVDGVNSYSCNCSVGFTGDHCETDIDDCVNHTCANGGSCVDGVNGYSCNCFEGYNGYQCESDVDDCTNHTCANGGSCVDGVNSYSCNCAVGYTGDHCQTGNTRFYRLKAPLTYRGGYTII